MAVSEKAFEQTALEDPDGKWELHCGRLRNKPDMTTRHNFTGRRLGIRLAMQLPLDEFDVSIDSAYVRVSSTDTYRPDVAVIPMTFVQRKARDEPNRLEVYRESLPLVVEVWSPSTGKDDLDEKLPRYQARGDAEIWLLHPGERTLRAWVRGVDGTYTEQIHHGGLIQPAALPNVTIDLDELISL